MTNQTTDQSKEPFCGACLAIPLAMAGLGATKVSTDNVDQANSLANSNSDQEEREREKRYNNMLMWGGIILTILSVIAMIWYMSTCKKCNKALRQRNSRSSRSRSKS